MFTKLRLLNPEILNFGQAGSWAWAQLKSVDSHFVLVAVPKDNLDRNDPIAEHLEHELHSGQHAWNTNV